MKKKLQEKSTEETRTHVINHFVRVIALPVDKHDGSTPLTGLGGLACGGVLLRACVRRSTRSPGLELKKIVNTGFQLFSR